MGVRPSARARACDAPADAVATESNLRLSYALDKAKASNLPKDRISAAIERGSAPGAADDGLEEATYEGHGPGGTAVLVRVLTDNRKRTAPQLRHVFSRAGGALGKDGSVGYLFSRRAVFAFEGAELDEVMEVALEADAEECEEDEESGVVEVTAEAEQRDALRAAFDAAGLVGGARGCACRCRLDERSHTTPFLLLAQVPSSAEVTMLPSMRVELDEAQQESMAALLDALDDLDDVQDVYHNAG